MRKRIKSRNGYLRRYSTTNLIYPLVTLDRTCVNAANTTVQQKIATLGNDQARLAQLRTEHEAHLTEDEKFYHAMSKDVIGALPNDEACICFDFEKNLPLPVTNVTKEFFSRQLWLYNFGIHDLRGGASVMYVYSETYCHKGPNEIISSLKHYFENFIPVTIRKLLLFLDNSTGQNKNKYTLEYLASLHDRFEEIQISFPVVGHSRMPVDRDFAHLEKLRRKRDKFHFPSDWTNLIKQAQALSPFKLAFLEHPLTDDLCDDGTPVATVYDFEAAADPILNPPTGIMQMKGFKINT